MIRLNTDFSDNEKRVLAEYVGAEYTILDFIENESFVLCEKGEFFYNDCFEKTDDDYFKQLKYERIVPRRIIEFYQYYLMESKDEKNIWYRGRRDKSGNWEYDCYFESLEEILESL